MSDKKCGTCLCGQRPTVWCSCADQTKPARQPACDDYAERTDSVEQVARDMLADLMLLANYGDDYPEEYVERLKALGVEV